MSTLEWAEIDGWYQAEGRRGRYRIELPNAEAGKWTVTLTSAGSSRTIATSESVEPAMIAAQRYDGER